jgi:endonuclease/exonuclease/phosphatase family metal-dependent hydrolase
MTYNIQGSELAQAGGTLGIAEKIRYYKADVVGLQEVQSRQAAALARELGWQHFWKKERDPLGPVYAEGIGIISKYALDQRASWELDPPGKRHHRQLQRVMITVGGKHTYLYNTHLSSDDGSPESRKLQAQFIINRMERDRKSAGPSFTPVLVGDMNSDPSDAAINKVFARRLTDAWAYKNERANQPNCSSPPDQCGYTAPARTKSGPPWHRRFGVATPTRRLDYIFVETNGIEKIHTPTVDEMVSLLSDHVPVIAALTDGSVATPRPSRALAQPG